jgi:hypothetical protein
MSNVLAFRPASAGGPASSRPASVAAEIVIFPGVRYERRVEDVAPEPEPQRGGGHDARRRSKRR